MSAIETSLSQEGIKLRLTEIFYSLQGEADTVGCPTVFIRLTGCPLRCQYCDTAYAFTGGQWYSLAQIMAQVADYHCTYVTVTGGEPLAQKNCLSLLTALCEANYRVSLETSGALPLRDVDSRVVKVMDIKTPGSGESHKNLFENLDALTHQDLVKFVICDAADFSWAQMCMEKHDLIQRCQVLFSPSYTQLPPTTLAQWILDARLKVRFQIQLHKVLWGDTPGR